MRYLPFLHFVRRYRILFVLLALASFTASAVSSREWLHNSEHSETHNAPQGDVRRDRIESEVISILPTGFEPSEITRSRGQFLILIDDRSELDELTLRLTSVAGQRVRELRKTKKEKTVKQLEDLPPGEYLLTEASHPDWVCRIKISPQ